jgi:hypothetical protein
LGAFIAKAASGHTETLRINGKQIKWVRPLQFTAAFRRAAEVFIRNPKNHKVADVPMTFDEIWRDIAEDFGPAPEVHLKDAPAASSGPSEPVSGSGSSPMAEPKTESPTSEPAKEEKSEPVKEEKPETAPPFEKKEESEDKQAKQASASIGKCAACAAPVTAKTGSEVAPRHFLHSACQEKAKAAAFNMFIPGQVAKEFYPDLLQSTIDYPTQPSGGEGYNPEVGLPGNSPSGVQQSADGLPGAGEPYISTKPSAAMGIGRDGKPQIMDGAPLRQENDIRGYAFDQEYYAQQNNLSPRAFVAAYAVERVSKTANVEENQAQFADFLKKAMGEIAATFIAAFKVTSRPLMNRVPGTGELLLEVVEANATPLPPGATNIASRVRYLVDKLTDSQITDAMNAAWAEAAVWNEDPKGGYTYEIFVRPESIDKKTMVLKYSFVVGTRGL